MRLRSLITGLVATTGVWGQLLGRQNSGCDECTQDEVCRVTEADGIHCIPANMIDTTTVTVTSFTFARSTRTRTTVVSPRTSTSTSWSTVTAFTTSLPAETDEESSTTTTTTSKINGRALKGRQESVADLFEAVTVSTTIKETSYTGDPTTTTLTRTSGSPITAVAVTAATTTVWQTTSADSQEDEEDVHHGTPTSTVAGAIAGVIVALAFIAGIAWFMRKKSKQNHAVEKKTRALTASDSEMQLPRTPGDETDTTTSSPSTIPPFPFAGSTATRLAVPDPSHLHQKPHHQRNPSALSLTHVSPRLSLTFPPDSDVSPIEGESPFTAARRRSTSQSTASAKRTNVIPRKPVPTSPDAGTPGRAI